MQMSVVIGKPIRDSGEMIVIQNGETMDSFNRRYYRQAAEGGEPVALVISRQLPTKLAYNVDGAILIPK